tara:strand:+ start:1162 stop:1752 length:591 start_codon:yes stop_codon:yes gene_type:complete
MPRMDEVDFKQNKFKRTSFRSWDTDLVSSLKMDAEEEKPSATKTPPVKKERVETVIPREQEKKIIEKKVIVKAVSKKPTSNHTQVIDTKVPFLDEDFRATKLIKRLTGNEKKFFLLVIQTCNARGSTKTGSISSEDVEHYLSFTRNSRESAIKRLCEKGLIKRNKGKRGQGGTINLSVSDKVLEVANKLILEGDFD